MPLNINKLGWLPDYPDSRDLTLNDLSENIIKQEDFQSQDSTEFQIVELLEKLVPTPSNNLNTKKRIENLKKIIKKDQNQIVYLQCQSETKVFLYRTVGSYWVKEIQIRLHSIIENSINYLKSKIKGLNYDYAEAEYEEYLKKYEEYLKKLLLENGYFGEATHHLMIYFKEIWELPSQSSIVDFDYNSDREEITYYQYNQSMTIYRILDTIYHSILDTIYQNQKNNTEKPNKDLIKFGDFGDEVIHIKKQLERLNYFSFSKEDNYEESKYFFGFKTDLVVEFFQGFNGLQADGIVGSLTRKKLSESEIKKDEIINDKTRIQYLHKRLCKDFGIPEIKVASKLNLTPEELEEVTQQKVIESINKIIESTDHSKLTMERVKNFLMKIIEKAENSKTYCLSKTLVFSDLNQDSNNNFNKSNFLMVEQPISKNIIDIFKQELNFIKQSDKNDIKTSIHNNDNISIVPVIYPLIQFVIKNLSDMGIHGQSDYEKTITQAINIVNIILDADQNSSSVPVSYSVENYLQKQQFSNDMDERTQFLFEFIRGRKSGERELDFKLIYYSLSPEERKRLTFLIFITLDQIKSLIPEIKEQPLSNLENKIITNLQEIIKKFENNNDGLIKDILKSAVLDKKNFDFFIKEVFLEEILKNKTILRIFDEGKQNQLQIPLLPELENQIRTYQTSNLPVYLCLPEFVDLSHWCSPIRNQEPLNSCTACAAIALIEYFQNRNRDEYTNASVLFLYKVARKLMHREGDVGASIRETMKAMVLFGIPPEEYWPYDPSKIDEEPSGFCYSYAENYKTIQYFRLDTLGLAAKDLLAQIKMTLVAGIPSMFGLTIYSSIYKDFNYKRGYIPIPNKKDQVEGGHALVAVGYDDHKIIGDSVGALLIRNSWGTNWGEGGYGWLPYDYILRGLTSDWWSLLKAQWFETKNFGLGANDWKSNDIKGDDQKGQ